ncbi:MAG: hypothetical protein ACRC9P_05320, partial [Bacteroides sp.]
LHHPELKNVNPHNLKDSSKELRMLVMKECYENPWYYFREVIRVPASGGAIPFNLHRANLAMYWNYFQNITTLTTIPRQQGKTAGSTSLQSYYLYIYGHDFTFLLVTREAKLQNETVDFLKGIRDALPKYLLSSNRFDKNNTQEITYNALNNKYLSALPPMDEGAAEGFGRGLRLPSKQVDEFAFLRYNWVFWPVMLGTALAAKEQAKNTGLPYADILTTTAGRLSSRTGAYAYEFVKRSLKFHEKFYDMKDGEELQALLKKNTSTNMFYLVYSFLQLGKTMEWFEEEAAKYMGDQDRIDRDLKNVWSSGTDDSLIKPALLNKIKENEMEPLWVDIHDGYATNWYIPEDEVRALKGSNRSLVMGVDMSENI